MWNIRKDRDDGGPVLRDPMANPNRRVQPYSLNFSNRQQNKNGNFNDNNSFRSRTSEGASCHSWFPPALEEAPFPPTPQTSIFQQGHASLLPVLGFQSGVANVAAQMDAKVQEPLLSMFSPGSAASLTFGSGNEDVMANTNPFSFNVPAQVSTPCLLPNPLAGFLNQGPSPFSGGPSNHFDNNLNFSQFEEQQPEQTLNLQPQWSVDNSDHVRRSSIHENSKLGFDRRPFNSSYNKQNTMVSADRKNPCYENNNGQGFERRPIFNYKTSQPQKKPQTLNLQPQRSISSLHDAEMSSTSKFGDSHTSSSVSFSSSHYQNTQGEQSSSSHAHSQQPIPSLMSMNTSTSTGFNPGNRNKRSVHENKGKNFNQHYPNKRPMPSKDSSSVSRNVNGNNITITPSKTTSGPLLHTPRLIPYPPPPLNPRPASSTSTTSLLRNPRGILKNSSSSDYSNFVRESNVLSSNENSPSPVVPYDDDDDDDDDDVEFVSEAQSSNASSSNMTHDFFSEKMVHHFASILTGKPIEEQLDGLLKYLVLPADFLATRVSIVRNLHVMLADTFKNCVLQPYGADFIGVGNSDDSVNMFVDLTGKQGPSAQIDSRVIEPLQVTKENLDELLNLIQEDKNHKFFGQIVRRTNFSNSRVNLPVISFIHSETKVRCSIRLDNYLVVQEAKIIQFVCSLDSRIPSLLALVRYWSSVHKVLDTPEEDTKNRFVTLLMLFHLARKKIIPTFAHLQSLSVKREYFNNLEIGFCDDFALVPQNDNPALDDKTVFTLSTLSLLKEYFRLFGNAKLKDEVISLWKAEFIPKENFSPELEGKLLSPDLRKRYRYGVNGKLRNKRLDCSSRLCVQDFQDLSENLTIAVAEYDVSKFQVECNSACEKLESIMSSGSSLMDLFVVSDYASFGTEEHRDVHKLVYLLFNIADERAKRNAESQGDSTLLVTVK